MSDSLPFTILGAGGFVGSHLVRHLRARGIGCSTPTRADEASLFERPLGDVIYCIGLTADYRDRPFDTVDAHVSLLNRILHQANFASLVYLSSTRLYDGNGPIAREEDDLTLNPLNPRHLYDLSKALGEAMCFRCSEQNVRVARLSCVYSEDLSADNFIHSVIKRALTEARITLETQLDIARDYVHMEDVCRSLIGIARHGRRPIYNVASGVNVSNRDLLPMVQVCTGCHIEVVEATERISEVLPIIDITALRSDLTVTPRRIEETLATLVDAGRAAGAARRAM